MSFGSGELTAMIQSETLSTISTGLTHLRQVVSLHPTIALEMKQQLAATSRKAQRLMTHSLDYSGWIAQSDMQWRAYLVVSKWKPIADTISELETLAKDISNAESKDDQAVYQSKSENVAKQLLDLLETVCQQFNDKNHNTNTSQAKLVEMLTDMSQSYE